MKRILLTLVLFSCLFTQAVYANGFVAKRENFVQNLQDKSAQRAVLKVMSQQNKYAAKFDIDGLSALYSPDFLSDDGFKKDVYMQLVEDTWKSYPDIKYTSKVKNVKVDGDNASIEVYETSTASNTQVEEGVTFYGNLNSYSNGTYYLKKVDNKWLISGEKIAEEKSFLRYGDLRFVEMDLNAPLTVKPKEYYTSSLKVVPPSDSLVVASIARDSITYPQKQPDEVFRKLPDDYILERMLTANSDGKNEYNVASIAMSKAKISENRMRVYITGLAFIMTRVNVAEGEDAKENQ